MASPASSSDDDDSSSSSQPHDMGMSRTRSDDHLRNDESDSDSDSSASTDDNGDEKLAPSSLPKKRGGRSMLRRDDDVNSDESEDSDDESRKSSEADSDDNGDSSDGDDDDAPLHERVRKKEEKGVSLKAVRSRRSRALELASERLKKFKQENKNEKSAKSDQEKISSKKKRSKHAPAEVSSKRADFFRRGTHQLNESGLGVEIGANRYKPLDPRASSLHGHFDEEQFEKNYAFLQDMRKEEIAQLKRRIFARKQTGNKGRRLRKSLKIVGGSLEEDKEQLKTLILEQSAVERRKIDRAAKRQVKKKVQEDVAQGKSGAYFLKRKDKKRLELEAKFELIRKRGGDQAVEKVLAKKRRKNKSRDASAFTKQT